MRSCMPLHFSFLFFATSSMSSSQISATKRKCQEDCHSVERLVGPTRPWHAADDMGSKVNLTLPYPYFSFTNDNHSLDQIGGFEPSTFSKFCEVGCSLFHSSKSEPTLVSDCIDSCDSIYRYNITVGYNDLAEMARLECRDGCQIALKRCQPGHYCTQVHVHDNQTTRTTDSADSNVNASSTTNTYSAGIMYQCPPGTYRDVSYDAVEECIACPLNHFRQKSKGESRESCTKCPANTYTTHVGSSSQANCLRCPAGTFNRQPGSPCECITPGACKAEQLPSPADAEKRDTVPFIGRW